VSLWSILAGEHLWQICWEAEPWELAESDFKQKNAFSPVNMYLFAMNNDKSTTKRNGELSLHKWDAMHKQIFYRHGLYDTKALFSKIIQ